MKGILAECVRLKDEPVPAAELKKAKDYIAGTTCWNWRLPKPGPNSAAFRKS